MRAMRAEQFSGYEGLKPIDHPKPAVSDGKVLLRMTAAGVTPLEHTILSGQFPLAKAPLVLGSEGAGVVEEGGGTDFPAGYAASRKATIDVTNLIWQQANIQSFILFAQPKAVWADAWNTIVALLQFGAIKPIVAKTFPLAEAADALRYLVEGRPFGRVILTI